MKTDSIKWKMIKNAILKKKAILFLGPGITLNYNMPNREEIFLEGLAAQHNGDILSFHKKDGFLVFKNENVKLMYLHELRPFYESNFSNPLLEQIAEIPFHTIISVTPDQTLHKIFEAKNFAYSSNYYKAETRKELHEFPTPEKPLIYSLLGSVKEDESLVLSHYDLFNTIQSVYADKNFPSDLSKILSREHTNNIIFLGFDFEKWYFQLILHYLKVNFSPCIRYAAAEKVLDAPMQTLYESQFDINFASKNLEQFVNTLYNEFTAGELRKPTEKTQQQRKYRKKNIIKLLAKAFNSTDFETFCMINYEDVYDDFTDGQSRTARINRLMDYVERQADYDNLLEWVKEENPIQYKQNEPYYDAA